MLILARVSPGADATVASASFGHPVIGFSLGPPGRVELAPWLPASGLGGILARPGAARAPASHACKRRPFDLLALVASI